MNRKHQSSIKGITHFNFKHSQIVARAHHSDTEVEQSFLKKKFWIFRLNPFTAVHGAFD